MTLSNYNTSGTRKLLTSQNYCSYMTNPAGHRSHRPPPRRFRALVPRLFFLLDTSYHFTCSALVPRHRGPPPLCPVVLGRSHRSWGPPAAPAGRPRRFVPAGQSLGARAAFGSCTAFSPASHTKTPQRFGHIATVCPE